MSSSSPPQRLDHIDALRGFAAVWVFLYHIWNVLYPLGGSQVYPIEWDASRPWHFYPTFFLFQYGYFGVTIFFVVSGFCIHLPQARRHAATGQDGLKLEPFFQRRFWRLYPAYFASLFVASLSLGVMRLMEYRERGWPLPLPDQFYEQAFGVYEIGYNALFLLPFIESAKNLNSVLWTLVFEVQFYLAYPMLLWCIRRIGLVPVGLALLIAEVWFLPKPVTAETLGGHDPWFYFFLGKYFEWFLGVVAAEWLVNQRIRTSASILKAACVLGIAFSMGSVFVPVLWPFRDIAVAVTTFLYLLTVLPGERQPSHASPRWLKLFVWLGAFSYSLYLLHIPLLRIVYAGNTLLMERFTWLQPLGPWLLLDSIPIVILASWGFYWLFERPFLKGK